MRINYQAMFTNYSGDKTADLTMNDSDNADLALRGERRLRRILRGQTLAHITTQLKDGASSTVIKQIVQRSLHRMSFGSRRPTRVPLLNARPRAAHRFWRRKHRDWGIEEWKRVAWCDEYPF
ncbi:HTH_Tnp_Tc3_2 domain-containing protein [Trichonephila clavipes]|nr:HTH_Tnp_Tc3_2 domain-containing protein [Trichonephila clavipes]